MQPYKFDKIYSQMAKEFGRIGKGEEDPHAMLLFALETNAMKVHRAHPSSNSRRLREAIGLVLFDIKDRLDGGNSDTDNIRNEDNERLEKALLIAFDPFFDAESQTPPGEMDAEELHEYYREPVMCLLRIKDSIDLWEKNRGSDGYFDFLEGYMGAEIRGDKMTAALTLE